MKQSGYALLLGLFVLLGISGAWVVGNVVPSVLVHAEEPNELQLARQALISYSVNYIDHYGPQGAGIGHLPCPDTDKPNKTPADPWAYDGPNPPCAKHAVAVGWLPRHVDTVGGRYHFHTQSRQRFWYAVSDEFINNPVNRVVNATTVGRMRVGSHDHVVAVITMPTLELAPVEPHAWWEDREYQPAAFTMIRAQDIIEPAKRRVASWLLPRLNAAKAKPPCALSAEHEMLHWLSKTPPLSDCAAHKQALITEFVLYERVPYARHWFFRNRWFEHIRFELNATCFQALLDACQFSAEPPSKDTQAIVIHLQESAS